MSDKGEIEVVSKLDKCGCGATNWQRQWGCFWSCRICGHAVMLADNTNDTNVQEVKP